MDELLPALRETWWVPLVSALLGVWVGHALAIGRDRRNDFNKAAQPIRAYLLHSIVMPSPMDERPTLSEMDLFEQGLRWFRRPGWRRAWRKQQEKRAECLNRDEAGGAHYARSDEVRQALRKCLPYTNNR